MAAVTTLPFRPGQVGHLAVLIALAAWAFLCHVSTLATLLTTLTITAFLYWWSGGPALRAPAQRVLMATIIAAVLSIVAYYGHFGTVYTDALRLRAQTTAAAPAHAAQPAGGGGESGVATKYRTFTPLPVRIRDALVLTVHSVGWPILALAGVGAWRAWIHGARDRLLFAVLAWTATYLIFLAVAVMRVDVPYQRYSYEFVGRLTFATYPAAILLAGSGAAWAWRAGLVARIASGVLLLSAVVIGMQSWLQWLH
jgi:hypothetical protein